MVEREQLEKKYEETLGVLKQQLQVETDALRAEGKVISSSTWVVSDADWSSLYVDSNGEWSIRVGQTGGEIGSDLDRVLLAYSTVLNPLNHSRETILNADDNEEAYLTEHGNVLLELLIQGIEATIHRRNSR